MLKRIEMIDKKNNNISEKLKANFRKDKNNYKM